MSEQTIIVPSHALKHQLSSQQQLLQYQGRGSVYQDQGRQSVQYGKQQSLDSNNIYIQSPVVKKSVQSPVATQFAHQSISSPKNIEFNTRQSLPQVSSFQTLNQHRPSNFSAFAQSIYPITQVKEFDSAQVQSPVTVMKAVPQIPLQTIVANQIPNQVVQLKQQQQVQQPQQQAVYIAQVPQQQIAQVQQVQQNVQRLKTQEEIQQSYGIMQLAHRPELFRKQEQQQKNMQRQQSLQNLQSYQQLNSPKAQFTQTMPQTFSVAAESTPKVLNGYQQVQQQGAANVRMSVTALNQNVNPVQSHQIRQIEEAPKRSQKTVTQAPYVAAFQPVQNGYQSKQDYVVENQQQEVTHQKVIVQKEPVVVKEKITYIKDTAKVEELESKIRILLDNIEGLNKTIYLKETEITELNTNFIEMEHLKRTKTRIQEENQSLKLQIEEWQRRYNVLELQGYDKNSTQFIATGYTAQDAESLYNSLKIKQEENEALKTTIARLELNQGNERCQNEEIIRLNDLVELKTKQCEEWKQKYINMETFATKNRSKIENGELNHYGQKDNVLVNSETPIMSCVFNELNYQPNGKDITQLARFVHEKEETPKRSHSGSLQYSTSALFKKKNNQNSPQNTGILGATSYMDDIKLNKKFSYN